MQSWRFGKAKKYPSNTDTGFNYYPHGKRFCFPEDAQATARIRAILKTKGTPIGPYDVMLAGCAKQRNLIFVTDNTKEFQKIDGLVIENWVTRN